jgi:hypothetical protein
MGGGILILAMWLSFMCGKFELLKKSEHFGGEGIFH